jgi:DNA-binding CsgD family transcriptional regulator
MSAKTPEGTLFKSLISDTPADLTTNEALHYKATIPKFREEAIFVYSLKENKMIYADGWEEILGYKDDSIGMLTIVKITTPEYAPFANEVNDKAISFILGKTEDLEKYSFAIELKKTHKNGTAIPLIARVGVFKAENGKVKETIGRFQVNRSINFGKVMRYEAYGPEKSEFEEELNRLLFKYCAISKKEKEALSLAAKGYSIKEIASHYNVSQSAIEKRIFPLYKRFEVNGLPHLISFAYDNYILP